MTIVEQSREVVRLTERGLGVLVALVSILVLAGVLCVGVTAARVMAEPASAQVASGIR